MSRRLRAIDASCIGPVSARSPASASSRWTRSAKQSHIQHRDGGSLVLQSPFARYPFLQKTFADGGRRWPLSALPYAASASAGGSFAPVMKATASDMV